MWSYKIFVKSSKWLKYPYHFEILKSFLLLAGRKNVLVKWKVKLPFIWKTQFNQFQLIALEKDPVVIEKGNLISLLKLVIKEVIETSMMFAQQLDSDFVPVQHVLIVIEHVLRHGLKNKKVGPGICYYLFFSWGFESILRSVCRKKLKRFLFEPKPFSRNDFLFIKFLVKWIHTRFFHANALNLLRVILFLFLSKNE